MSETKKLLENTTDTIDQDDSQKGGQAKKPMKAGVTLLAMTKNLQGDLFNGE